ncbi:MAG TPA: alpha/beta hydrolase [Candidatus Sulfotelmatobacter sp.]|jgi:pimeloyl-ACP methyl ester carboxylesterase|nr:alpha/beta hydrolase [Candidatus Sulfotelmatobacter sp.]
MTKEQDAVVSKLYQTQTVKFESGIEGQSLTVAVNYRKGSDTLILFLHGLGGTKDTFSDVWGRAELREESLLVPDLIGFGDSSRDTDFSYSLEDHATILKQLIGNYPHKELHIVAHSMGGAIGVLLAEQLPELQSFVDIDGNLIPNDGGLLSRRTAGSSFENFRDKKFEELRHQMVQDIGIGALQWVNQSRKADPLAFYKSARSLVSWSDSGELLERFHNLQARKLFIFGDRNKGMSVLSWLDPDEMLMIDNSGHFVMNDAPNKFYPKLAAFIKNN